ncbi:hypothetical protein ACEWPL_003785 [Roseovarius sp. S1116L3]|uniref:hypothetical protein n=1 Tax=Roseovarius roseus TaxID=3342636 RepID=UPI003727D48E
MTFKAVLAASALALTATPLFAENSGRLTYDQFELAVPHMDLATCPPSMEQEDSFCRATLRHDEIHVFAFRNEGDQPMTGFKSFPAEGLSTLLD